MKRDLKPRDLMAIGIVLIVLTGVVGYAVGMSAPESSAAALIFLIGGGLGILTFALGTFAWVIQIGTKAGRD